jgi:hypothetical protein
MEINNLRTLVWSVQRRSAPTSHKSKVLIKALHGMEAFELMQSLGIFNAKGKPNPAYR